MRFALGLTFSFALALAACDDAGTSGSLPDASIGVDARATSDAEPAPDAALVADAAAPDAAAPDAAAPDAALPDAGEPDAQPIADGGEPPDGGSVERPYGLTVPASYTPGTPMPLVILLHGYGTTGPLQSLYFGFGTLADTAGFLFAYPNGTIDSTGNHFWNATDACCNFDHTAVDDVAYLTWLIDDVSARYDVDPRRVYFVGHSNGAFMAYRMACELSTRVAAIVGLAGAMWLDTSRCQPTDPVAVLHVHGDADDTITYGGTVGYPSAMTSVSFWAAHDGCSAMPQVGAPRDIDLTLPGTETAVSTWTGCTGGAAELWTIQGGGHIPNLGPSWGTQVWSFLAAHPKP